MSDTRITQMSAAVAACVDVIGDQLAVLAVLADEDPHFALPVGTALERATKCLSAMWDTGETGLQHLKTADRIENGEAA